MNEEPSSIVEITTALARFDRVAGGIAELRQQFDGVIFDVTTTAGMEAARVARRTVREPRVEVEKIRQDVKRPLLDLGRKIDTEAARITADLLAIENPIDQQIKAEEKRKEEEKQAKLKAERDRIAGIQARISAYAAQVTDAVRDNLSSDDILRVIENMTATDPDPQTFGEFVSHAEHARNGALVQLRRLHTAAVEREQQQAEQARIAAEQAAERQRIDAERARVEAELAAERERLDAERRRVEAEQAAARAKLEAETRAERQRIAAERAAEQAAMEAERKRLAAEQAALQAQRDRIAAEQATPEPEPEPEPEPARNVPTVAEMLEVLADHYNVAPSTVREWLAGAL